MCFIIKMSLQKFNHLGNIYIYSHIYILYCIYKWFKMIRYNQKETSDNSSDNNNLASI